MAAKSYANFAESYFDYEAAGDDEEIVEAEEQEEGMVGNVCNQQMIPPNHNGPPQKGHLIFNANFECGNLGKVECVTEYEFNLFIRPDTCNSRYRVWFYFTVSNCKRDQRVLFNIVNYSKAKSLYREGQTPLVYSTSRCKWQRIPTTQVYYYRCSSRKNYIMSLAFVFDVEETYSFAYCYPYTYTQLQDYLDNLEEQDLPYIRRELLGVTVQQRRLDLLTITHPDNLREGVEQRVAFITARVHPGETPASFICHGFMEFLVSQHTLAKALRKYIVFMVVPMLNPDGVYLGNYRCSLMGFDLNRQWSDPSPWAHPSVHSVKNYLKNLDQDENISLDFYIDIHAHTTLLNVFMFGNVFEDGPRHDRQSVFPRILALNVEDFSMINTNFNKDNQKAGTGRRTLANELGAMTMCYTLEVSFFGWMSSNTCGTIVPYTAESYAALGRNVCKGFIQYYRMQGLIPDKAIPYPVTLRPSFSQPGQLNVPVQHTSRSSKSPRRNSSSMVDETEAIRIAQRLRKMSLSDMGQSAESTSVGRQSRLAGRQSRARKS